MRISAMIVTLIVSLSSFAAEARADETPEPARRSSASHFSLAKAGLIMFAGSYAYSAALGSLYRNEGGGVATTMFVPIVGPWLTLKNDRFDGGSTITGRLIQGTGANSCSGDAAICPGVLPFVPLALLEYGSLLLDVAGQATGLVLAVVGGLKDGASDDDHAARAHPKISVSPTFAGGPGLSLSISHW